MRQETWCCTRCGSDDLYALGRCQSCYEAYKRNSRRFGGLREQALSRDRHCRLCLEHRHARLIVHHCEPGVNALERFATLCRADHNRLHFTKRLRYAHTAEFRRLWRLLHPRQPEQLQLKFVQQVSVEQRDLFAA